MDPLDAVIERALSTHDVLKGFVTLAQAVDEKAVPLSRYAHDDQERKAAKEQLTSFTETLLTRMDYHRNICQATGDHERYGRLFHWQGDLRARMVHHLVMLAPDQDELREVAIHYPSAIMNDLIPYWIAERERLAIKGDAGRVEAIDTRVPRVVSFLGERGQRRLDSEKKWFEGRKRYLSGDTGATHRLFEESKDLLNTPDLYLYLWRKEREIGEFYVSRGEDKRALEEYEKDIRGVEVARAQTRARFRTDMAKLTQPLFYGAVRTSFKQGLHDRCLLFIEMAKGRGALDTRGLRELARISANRAGIPTRTVPEERKHRLAELLAQHDAVYRERSRASQGPAADPLLPDTEDLDKAIAEAFLALDEEQTDSSLVTVFPRHIASFLAGDMDVTGLFSAIPERGVAVEYFFSDGELVILLISKQGILKAERFAVAPGFYGACREALLSLDRPHSRRKDLLAYLYDVLVRPIEGAIPEETELLYIVPHAILHYLPFQAFLRTDLKGGEEYLVSRYDIVYAPSLGLLDLITPATETGEPAAREPMAVVMGNPDLGSPALNLPGAESEAKQIAAVLRVEPYLRGGATRDVFLSKAPDARFISLACHARPSISNPLLGYLALSDAPLRVVDILGLDLGTDLLLLSGCHTRVERVGPGDETAGLAQAFFAAGVRSIVASLWEAHDHASRSLMNAFLLHHVKGGLSKPRALRLAQLELMSSSHRDRSGKPLDFSNPYYWAFPVLFGDCR